MCMLCEPLVDAGLPEDDDILVACARDELKDAGLDPEEAEFNLEVMRDAGCFRAPHPG
jgi:hypothetical protein